MIRNLGGQRLGSGKNMNIALHNYERSTHNLSRVWRSTMAPGTLVPFLTDILLPGDTFDVDIESMVKTMPTNGALMGTFKMQCDLFSVPLRLFQSELHMNLLGVGMNMAAVKLPMMEFSSLSPKSDLSYKGFFNQSSLMAYLGIRGVSNNTTDAQSTTMYRNSLFLLAYYDIFKTYYANKQESLAWQIVPYEIGELIVNGITVVSGSSDYNLAVDTISGKVTDGGIPAPWVSWTNLIFNFDFGQYEGKLAILCTYKNVSKWWDVNELGDVTVADGAINVHNADPTNPNTRILFDKVEQNDNGLIDRNRVKLSSFSLSNIDAMRESIMKATKGVPVVLTSSNVEPYKTNLNVSVDNLSYNMCSQNGLVVKTYQSDIFNNWLQTDWLDGVNGINEITAIDTSEGNFKMDTLNLAKKVYDMLNRIAVSGGSYQDWSEAVYGEDAIRLPEIPLYCGGMSREIVFSEVVNTTDSVDDDGQYQSSGWLTGKGGQSDKKGGYITIKCTEPSLLMGIVSLTPRIDYSQGIKWYTRLETMDDLHKPGLDGIGFQELITEQMAYWDSKVNNSTGVTTFKSAGKQPSWINYMTAYNECYGEFAHENSLMFLTLARRYEMSSDFEEIDDLTTYIDPTKYNYAFAQSSLDAQNFWVQIACDITARRKMSAKIIPNL